MSNRGRKIDVSLRPFQHALRRLGFRQEYSQRATKGCPLVQEYRREYPEDEVCVHVRLWGDGAHRVTYSHPNLWVTTCERYGHETTQPVDFRTVGQMLNAIEDQRTHWLRVERAVEEEYVAQCTSEAVRDERTEPDSRDAIRERLAKRAHLRVVSSAYLDDQGEFQ